MIKAVFFDLDGVLIDSERQGYEFIKEFLVLENIPIPPERFKVLVGTHNAYHLWDGILEGIQLNEHFLEFRKRMNAYKAFRMDRMKLADLIFPDIEAGLKALKQRNVKIVCASSSRKSRIEQVLSDGNLLQYFDLIVSGQDCSANKPNPDIYLHCMKLLNLKPEECLVVEDSPIGIQAGKSAGLTVVARVDQHFNMDQSQADAQIETLLDLFQLEILSEN